MQEEARNWDVSKNISIHQTCTFDIFRFVFIGSIVLSPNLDRLQLNYATSSCNLICFPFPLKFVQVNGEIMASVIAWLQNYSGIALLESYRFICLG
ncbi:Guanine nucleotide-binding protein G(o) subunit alpha [Trichinella pseudospiralis]